MKKQSLRDQIKLTLYKKLAEVNKSEADQAICKTLFDMLRPFGFCASYIGLSDEPELKCLIEKRTNTQFLYPRVNGANLDFYKVSEESDLLKFKKSAMGISEPTNEFEMVSPEAVEVFLVPGVGFDKKGYRLGRGKGFYDRLLENTKALKIGICYSWQIQEQGLVVEDHDQKMDYIICEKYICNLTSNN